MPALSDTAIRKAKPAAKPVKLRDGGGLYLLLRPDGARWWRWDYRRPVSAKRNTLSLGTYPDVSLADARTRHGEARKLLAAGIDPGEQRKAEKAAGSERAANTFGAVAAEMLAMRARKLSPGSVIRERRLAEQDLAGVAGVPVAEITAPALLAVLRKIEARGAVETAHRARALASMVFRYAIATGKAERDPAADLKGALSPPQVKHFASLTEPAQIGPLLRALWGYDGSPVVQAALKLAPMTFARPGQ
ncbi:MAG: integrase arm-type DNA-binding domain-containing protein [Pseudoxanthomonas sp.]